MLSVPGAIASERSDKKFNRNLFTRTWAIFLSFFPFLNLNTQDDTSSDTDSNDDSSRKLKVTGGKMRSMLGNRNYYSIN